MKQSDLVIAALGILAIVVFLIIVYLAVNPT